MITRRFEYVGHGSDKFWEVTYPDWSVDRGVRTWTCRWGRRGTNGQTKTFTELSQLAAMTAANDKISEKVRKGYGEILPTPRVTITTLARPRRIERAERTRQPARPAKPAAPAIPERPKRKITIVD